ncbi:DUF3592 domain-containing protein [Pararhodobacter sp.]|uniref:DUF3592 domain-containing protein n=1 Tax=Pararhodobacter sp. TaxID=2127056 RepID=UPI002AFFBE18|nr:DUF3592 domain-containing protein [Pararhodobacter sp.]
MDRPTLSRKIYTKRASFVLAFVFLIMGGLTAAFSVYELREAALLANEGVDTTGVVIDRSTSVTRRSNGSTSRNYNLVIRFTGPDGAPVEVNRSVSAGLYEANRTGSTLPVRYARSHPTTIELVLGQTGRTGKIVGYIAIGFGVALLISLLVLLRGAGAQRRAAQEGERRMATVTDHKRIGKAKSNRWTFGWEAGTTRGRSGQVTTEALPDIGEPVAVYVDPRSGRGWWEGDY